MRGGRVLLASLVVTAALSLVACGAADAPTSESPATSDTGSDQSTRDSHDIGMPEECTRVSAGWLPGADIADVEALPADWPAPPDGSTLCMTLSGGSTETAAYASPLPIEDVFAHYEANLPPGLTVARSTGEENGTGYDTLDGEGAGISFQIRRNDGGFTLVVAGS